MRKYLGEVEKRLKSIRRVSKPSIWKAESYIGGGRSRLKYLDLKIPDVRNEFKKGFSFYDPKLKEFNPEQLEIFEYVWKNSSHFEAMLFSLLYLNTLSFEHLKANRKRLLGWLDYVDNWAHSDELSKFYSELLEDDPKLISIYRSWNKSTNSWKRRQSIVGILFYSRFRKKRFLKWNQIKELVDPLLRDEDYYVQKGVGWALREAYHWYPKAVYKYIFNNTGLISPTAWYACTEKMSAVEKKNLKKERKNRRKNANVKISARQ